MKQRVGSRTLQYVALVLLAGTVLIAAGGQGEAEELGEPNMVLELTAEGMYGTLIVQ